MNEYFLWMNNFGFFWTNEFFEWIFFDFFWMNEFFEWIISDFFWMNKFFEWIICVFFWMNKCFEWIFLLYDWMNYWMNKKRALFIRKMNKVWRKNWTKFVNQGLQGETSGRQNQDFNQNFMEINKFDKSWIFGSSYRCY